MKNLTTTVMNLVLISSLLLSGCSEVQHPTAPTETDIEGTYSLESAYVGEQEMPSSEVTFTFSPNGKGYTVTDGNSAGFEWILDSELLRLNADGETTDMLVGVYGTMLTLEWDDDFEDIRFLKRGKQHEPRKNKMLKEKFSDKHDLLWLEHQEMLKRHDRHPKGKEGKGKKDCEKKDCPNHPEHGGKDKKDGKHKDHDGKGNKDHDSKKKGKYRKMLKLKKEG